MNVGTWPTMTTTQAASLASNWHLFLLAGLLVGGITAALIFYCFFRFRARPGDDALPVQRRSNNPLEIAWTVIPLVIVSALFVHTYRIESRVEALDPHPAADIGVTAYRWGWTFAYHGGPRISGSAANPPTIVIPVGEPTRIDVTSTDVTHSFWIPDFLFKRDAIPGQVTSFDLTPTSEGLHFGRCAQFCGLQHALMSFRVRVVDRESYRRWLADPRSERTTAWR